MQHVKDSVLTAVGGARRGVPKVLVVLTDGRSQDDVLQVSQEIQAEGASPRQQVTSMRVCRRATVRNSLNM